MRVLGTVAVGFLAAGLAGCYDELPNALVTNNSGQPIVIVEKAGADGSRRVAIAPGARSGRIVAYGAGRRFQISSGACVYDYVFPPMGVNFAWRTADGSRPDYGSHFPVLAQVEPDVRVYLLPPGTKEPVAPSRLHASQGHGFPLDPLSRDCP